MMIGEKESVREIVWLKENEENEERRMSGEMYSLCDS
jgi:hypothetical protein